MPLAGGHAVLKVKMSDKQQSAACGALLFADSDDGYLTAATM
jgi:hypothetical protein